MTLIIFQLLFKKFFFWQKDFICTSHQDTNYIRKNSDSKDFIKLIIHKNIPVSKSLFNKAAGVQLFIEKETPEQVFFYEFWKIF